MSINRKYVDSHWLIFAFEGVISLLFGWFALFTKLEDSNALIAIVGSTLLGLGIVELFNMLRRTHLNETWGFSLVAAMLEIATAFALLFTLNQNVAWHLALIAGYTVVRGVFEILIGLRSVDDKTDKSIWIIIGMCGVIMGFVILNSGSVTGTTMFLRFFGSYMMLYGLANIIYGVHNHDQKDQLVHEYSKAAKSASIKKVASKNVAKAPVAKKAAVKKAVTKPVAAKKAAHNAKKSSRR